MIKYLLLITFLFYRSATAFAQGNYWVYLASSDASDSVGIGIYDWQPNEGILEKVGVSPKSAI